MSLVVDGMASFRIAGTIWKSRTKLKYTFGALRNCFSYQGLSKKNICDVLELTVVYALSSFPAVFVEETDASHNHAEVVELLLLVLLDEGHEGPQL